MMIAYSLYKFYGSMFNKHSLPHSLLESVQISFIFHDAGVWIVCSQNGSTHAAVFHSMENHRVPLLLFQPHNFAVFSYNLQTAKFHHVASWTPKSRLKVFSGVIFPDLFRHFNNATLRIGTWEVNKR